MQPGLSDGSARTRSAGVAGVNGEPCRIPLRRDQQPAPNHAGSAVGATNPAPGRSGFVWCPAGCRVERRPVLESGPPSNRAPPPRGIFPEVDGLPPARSDRIPRGPGRRFLTARSLPGPCWRRAPRPSGGVPPQPAPSRDPAGHTVEPAADRIQPTDRAGPPHQDQESRLERILGVVRVMKEVPANAQHHRPVAQNQHLECSRITTAREPLQQLPIGQPRCGPRVEEDLDVARQLDGCTPGHAELPWTRSGFLPVVPAAGPCYP